MTMIDGGMPLNAFLHLDKEALASIRWKDRQAYKELSPNSLEQILIHHVLLDMQIMKEMYEDAIRLVFQSKPAIGIHLAEQILAHFLEGWQQQVFVQKYLRLACDTSVVTAIKYCKWVAKDDDGAAEQRATGRFNLESALKKLDFVRNAETAGMFDALDVPEFHCLMVDGISKAKATGGELNNHCDNDRQSQVNNDNGGRIKAEETDEHRDSPLLSRPFAGDDRKGKRKPPPTPCDAAHQGVDCADDQQLDEMKTEPFDECDNVDPWVDFAINDIFEADGSKPQDIGELEGQNETNSRQISLLENAPKRLRSLRSNKGLEKPKPVNDATDGAVATEQNAIIQAGVANGDPTAKDKPCKCQYCGKSFRSNSILKDHINIHTGETPYKCEICLKSFTSRDRFRRHGDVHTLDVFTCNTCSDQFGTRDGLFNHKKTCCPRTDMEPGSNSNNFVPYKCEMCEKSFQSRFEWESHLAMEHPDNSDPTNGDDQGRVGRLADLSSDIGAAIKNEEGKKESLEAKQLLSLLSPDKVEEPAAVSDAKSRYKCEYCGKCFRCNSRLNDHINTHTGDKPYKCEICGRGFTSKDRLRCHKDIHMASKFPCNLCDKTFNTRDSVVKHKKANHREELKDPSAGPLEAFVCHICNKEFKTKSVLKQHVSRHSGEKPFKCDICSGTFNTAHRLLLHKDNHTGEKFTCDICGKIYNLRDSLRSHVLTVHRGEKGGRKKRSHKKEMCSYCGIVKEKRYLRYHIYRHTGEKPFKCEECPKAFTTPTDLFLHKDVHSSKTFLCPSCGKVFNTYASLRTHKRKIHRNLMPVKAEEEQEIRS